MADIAWTYKRWVVPDIGQFRIHLTFNEYLHLMKIKLFDFFLLLYILCISVELCKNKICTKRCMQRVQTVLSEELSVINVTGDVRQIAYFKEHRR
jgi:hypothetical protein